MADKPDFLEKRLLSLDVYRGLIMISLAFSGFGIEATAKKHIEAGIAPDFWEAVHYQFDHAQWVGCGYWDLIQPSFMFMVGVAAAYSFSKRQETGQSQLRLFAHTLWRSLILIFLGIFLISNNKLHTEWSLMNVLSQIGLGYPFLFLLWNRSFRTQAIAAALILVGTWLAYTLYGLCPQAGIDIETGAPEVGINQKWAEENLKDVPPAWHKNANIGHAIDLWLLNLLPQQKPFEFNAGGYQTINFIPSLATMIFGLMAGQLLRSRRSPGEKLKLLLIAALAGFILGQVLNLTGVCPLVKRIWTPSWALFSTGWCLLILACLYGLIDVLDCKSGTFPFVVVGVNSIAIYCMGMLLKGWTKRALETHLGGDLFVYDTSSSASSLQWAEFGPLFALLPRLSPGNLWEPVLIHCTVGFVFWLVCLWMYRQKIFIRI